MFRFLTVAVVAMWANHVAAQDNVTTFTLDNGMQVVVVEDHRAPVVVHTVWYRVGSADEVAGKSGIAHFLEHLMFNATDTLEKGEFSKTVAANGGTDNAFTSYDYTAYYQRVAADRLGLMMEMESSRMTGLDLHPDDIVTERNVVIEERNQRTESDPGALFREQLRAAQYMNHRYAVPIIGWMHEIEQLNMDDAMEFYRHHYAPNNAILVVAGDVKPDDVRALAEEHYGPIPSNPDLKPRNRTQEPPHRSPRRLTFSDPRVAQPYVSRSYLAPERDSGDQKTAAALVFLAEVLGGSPATSVLGVKLQFDQKVAIFSNAYYGSTSLDDTNFGLVVVPAKGVTLQEAEDAMDAVVAQFMEDGVDSEAFARIKMQLRASRIYARDNVENIGQRYGRALTQGLTIEDVQAWPDLLQAVTEEDIMAAAKLVFNKDNSVTGWMMTEEDAK